MANVTAIDERKFTKKQVSNARLGASLFLPALILGMLLGSYVLVSLGVPFRTAAIMGALVGEAAAIATVWASCRDDGTTLKDILNLKKTTVKPILLAIGLGIALYVLLLIASSLVPSEGFTSDTSAFLFSASGLEIIFLLFVMIPFLAPAFEELTLRGALRNSLERSFGGSKTASIVAIIVSALIFAGMHFQGYSSLTDIIPLAISFTLGLISGILAYRTGSIWPCFALHMAYNGTTVAVVTIASMIA